MDGSLTKRDKVFLSIDFFEKEKIITKKEAKDIKAYLSGESFILDKVEEFEIDESDCVAK